MIKSQRRVADAKTRVRREGCAGSTPHKVPVEWSEKYSNLFSIIACVRAYVHIVHVVYRSTSQHVAAKLAPSSTVYSLTGAIKMFVRN